jgi:MinD superfamily P-loop ATPase
MKIAVLSGKGGTGKTLVAVNLAAVSQKAVYVDCDVEEPNGYLFFKPGAVKEEEIAIKIPVVNEQLCNGCRVCVDFCQFNALAYIMDKLIIFEQICHSCGGCALLCPTDAISERDKTIGRIEEGNSDNVTVHTGILNTGEASGIPIIRNLLSSKRLSPESLIFIDCPPGSACIVMETIRDADYCILVAEPTLFGVHNLNLVYDLVRLFKKPFGVVLNKCLLGEENPAEKFCLEKKIEILGRIEYDPELGTLNSDAKIVVREDIKYQELFSSLLNKVITEAQHEAAINS